MRLVLALAVGLVWTGAAVAQPAPDRYGPPRPATTPATPGALYEGPMLRWAAKRAPAPAAVAAVEPARAWTIFHRFDGPQRCAAPAGPEEGPTGQRP